MTPGATRKLVARRDGGGGVTAAEVWTEALAAWAIPEDILAAAPESPWGFPVALFHPAEDEPVDTPSRQAALDGLEVSGSGGPGSDRGWGGGAPSPALAPPPRSRTRAGRRCAKRGALA